MEHLVTVRDMQHYGIHIIGERHTGTSWLHNHLEQCFGDQIKVYDRLSRHKYWFQYDDVAKDYGLVIATSRNVYDWLYAMMENPLHAPIHYNTDHNISMSFMDFIQTEWAPDRDRWNKLQLLKDDQQILYAYQHADLFVNVTQGRPLHKHQCYDGFKFSEVIPCSYTDRIRTSKLIPIRGDSVDDGDSSAVYELRRDYAFTEIKPYKNIIELRRDKMINFHKELPTFSSVTHYIPFKFEDMAAAGTETLLQEIEQKMSLQRHCQPDKLQLPENGSKLQFLTPTDVSWINRGVDWDAEALVGYEKRTLNQAATI